jgi:hypothetical protein
MTTHPGILTAILATTLTVGSVSVALASPRSHTEDNRATAALNLLENSGYGIPLGSKTPLGSYAQFQTEGNDFAAYVVNNGIAERLRIDPDSGRIAVEAAPNTSAGRS